MLAWELLSVTNNSRYNSCNECEQTITLNNLCGKLPAYM